MDDEAKRAHNVREIARLRDEITELAGHLNAANKGCRFPGCSNTRHLDAHHIKHWSQGGETKPSNLVSLCGFHHRKVHEGGIQVQMLDASPSPWGEGRAKRAGEGVVRFVRSDGTSIDSSIPHHVGDCKQLRLQHAEQGIQIDRTTAATRWDGTRCDYGLGIESVLSLERVARESTPDEPAWMKKFRELEARRAKEQQMNSAITDWHFS